MSDPPEEKWHLSKAVPVSIIFFLMVQTIGIIIWAVRLDARVQSLEVSAPVQDARLDRLESVVAKVAVIEERQKIVMVRLDVQTSKLDQLLGAILKGNHQQ